VAANTLAYTMTELRRWVAREIGKHRTYASVDTDGQTDINDSIKAGLHQAYWPPNGHHWSFMESGQTQLELHGPYETGTVAVTLGVVTLTGGTFPSWAAQGDLWVNDGYYPVSTRDGNTQVTLVDTSLTGLSGESYSLKHREYDLPDDFGGLKMPFTYRKDQYLAIELTRVNEAYFRSLEGRPDATGEPRYYCVTSVPPTSTQESKNRVLFAPLPEAGGTRYVWYRYDVVPPMLDSSTYVYGHGGAMFHQVILDSCLDKALQMLYASDEKHGSFLSSLESATRQDLRHNRPQTHGFGVFSDGYDGGLDDYRRHRTTTIDTSNL
jgi:hypothetical protein